MVICVEAGHHILRNNRVEFDFYLYSLFGQQLLIQHKSPLIQEMASNLNLVCLYNNKELKRM